MRQGKPLRKEDLRIGVLTSTRFHMFDLVRQLKISGHKVTLLTGYPKWRLDPELRNLARTHPFLISALAGMYRYHIPIPDFLRWPWEHLCRRNLSLWACRHLKDVNVLDALSGWGLEAGRFVQENDGVFICNRGSAHILFQKNILEEENARWGALPLGLPSWVVDRETAEYATADAIAVPSHFAKRTFVEQGIHPEKVYVCPYGVDLSLFRPLPKEDAKFRVIFVGSYSIQKGLGYLFEAVRPLVRSRQVELWLIGGASPEAKDILSRNRDLFIDKGFQPRRKLARYYSQGSVLVLPSVQDGFGLVQAQAMACGLPVIATTNTGAEDLFTHGQEGFIVPIRDPLAIRERIEWMLANPEGHAAMGQAARQRVRTLGGWQAYGKQCAAMYRELLARKSVST